MARHLGTPLSWSFNSARSLGPDGPWSAIDLAIGWPVELVPVYPGQTEATLVISNTVCVRQRAVCSNPSVGFYDQLNNPSMTTADMDIRADAVPGWNDNLTNPLRVAGPVRQTLERIFVNRDPGSYLNNISILTSDGMTTNYAGGINISLDVGIMSLAARRTNFQQSAESSAKTYTPLEFLASSSATYGNPVPSLSWGLHMGSVRYNVTGSLLFGGYDQARVLQAPGVFKSTAITLTEICINSTIPAFQSTGNLMNTSNTPFSSGSSIPVLLEPALPYLYLPPAICNSFASYLPLVYHFDLDLYTWNTSDPSLLTLLTSLSNLKFTFTNSSGVSTEIAVPFALLNLTLTPPLVSTPTSYFPCRPYSNDAAGTTDSGSFQYYLGRAFLQGAFIGQNWGTGSYFVAQAPGPGLPGSRIVDIGANDTSVSAFAQAHRWEDTWKNVLSKDGMNQTVVSIMSSPSPPLYDNSDESPRLSIGSKVGISIAIMTLGLAAMIVIVTRIQRFKGQRRWSSTLETLHDFRDYLVIWNPIKRRIRFRGCSRRRNPQEFRIWELEPWAKPELGAEERIFGEMDGMASTRVNELSAKEGVIAEVEGNWFPFEVLGDVDYLSLETISRQDQRLNRSGTRLGVLKAPVKRKAVGI